MNPLMLWQWATWVAGAVPGWAWLTMLAAAMVSAAYLTGLRRQARRPTPGPAPERPPGRRLETLLTLAGAAVATGVAGVGMWELFGRIGVDDPLVRIPFFAFLEINLLAAALRARRNLRDPKVRKVGVDGAVVWILAAASGSLSALGDANTFVEALFRFIAPLVAAWGWERYLAPERRAARASGSAEHVSQRFRSARILVWLGLAEPGERAVVDVDRARRLARFVRAAYRFHTLDANEKAWQWRVAWAGARLRRQVHSANERLGLANGGDVRVTVQTHLATLYQVIEGTSPDAVRSLAPWSTERTPATGVDIEEDTAGPAEVDIEVDIREDAKVDSPPDIDPTAADIRRDSPPDINPECPVDTKPANEVDNGPDQVDTDSALDRTSNRTRQAPVSPETIAKVSKALAKFPNATRAELAGKARVSTRTVSRALKDIRPDNATANGSKPAGRVSTG